ncbi:MAG TPA: histidine phosphatase family protein [Gammaproteobacteria bacterium]|nr:histidine phosphatase family protein [Gammaproteobacteria bacterium]
MRVILLRHGKPSFSENGYLSARELHEWVEAYNSAGLMPQQKPPELAIEIASSCNTIVCSDLPRSIESARALGVNEIEFIEPIFREVELPHGSFLSPKLPPKFWVILFRVLCVFGYSSNGESLREAKLRTSKAASRLAEIAKDNGSVLLVGHGFTNRFIAKELLLNGWKGPVNPGKLFWEYGVYEYAT